MRFNEICTDRDKLLQIINCPAQHTESQISIAILELAHIAESGDMDIFFRLIDSPSESIAHSALTAICCSGEGTKIVDKLIQFALNVEKDDLCTAALFYLHDLAKEDKSLLNALVSIADQIQPETQNTDNSPDYYSSLDFHKSFAAVDCWEYLGDLLGTPFTEKELDELINRPFSELSEQMRNSVREKIKAQTSSNKAISGDENF